MLNIVLRARIKGGGILTDLELSYHFGDLPCFQHIPYKTLNAFIHAHPTPDTSLVILVDGFSVSIDSRPTAIAFNEIQLKHVLDDSLNFNLPLGLVARIFSSYGDIDFNLV